MASDGTVEDTAVIICGGGPTGVLLSAMLGRMGIPNVVLEKQKEIATDPRGIALDEDGIRCMQNVGLYDRIFSQIGRSQNLAFVAGSGHNLFKTPFLFQDLSTANGHSGHMAYIFHKQPEMERGIRDVIAQHPTSNLRAGCTLHSISEADGKVTAEYFDHENKTHKVSGNFLVGCDGKTGYVRKKYLEPLGITLDRSQGINYNETWVALNWHIRPPTPQTHPDFALWKLGYTPQGIYDAFFPGDFRFICDPSRPSVCGRFGLESDRLWRFEFVVLAGEDPEEMASFEKTTKIILPYLTHPGSWYGLKEAVQFPTDCIDTLRSRPFSFLGRFCNKWALDRVIVAGDAAHVFPPFGGQGIASGFRDASSLAWRLAHLHRHPHADHESLLRGWYSERKQQLAQTLAMTVRNGEFVTNTGILQSFVRDWVLWSMQQIPYLREMIQQGRRPSPRYTFEDGFPFRPDLGGGVVLSQVYCRRIDVGDDQVRFTDDLIFHQAKKGLLQLLIVLATESEVSKAEEDVAEVETYCRGFVRNEEETYLIHDLNARNLEMDSNATSPVARIASAEEFMSDPIMANNRPPPKLYDEMRITKDLRRGAKYVLVRRDWYVYAACVDQVELHNALRSLPKALGMPLARL